MSPCSSMSSSTALTIVYFNPYSLHRMILYVTINMHTKSLYNVMLSEVTCLQIRFCCVKSVICIKNHSLPLSTLIWFHRPYSATTGLQAVETVYYNYLNLFPCHNYYTDLYICSYIIALFFIGHYKRNNFPTVPINCTNVLLQT